MVDVHSFALPGFVSQATFALTLALLAWSDARTRGTRWLAAACALQLLIDDLAGDHACTSAGL